MAQPSLPQNLGLKSLAVFDNLLAEDRLKHQPIMEEIIEVNGLGPALVLHTRLFARQTDDLDLSDITAAQAVMSALDENTPQWVTYNCGTEAGASQGHKHMQIFALPTPFELFPEAAPQGRGCITTNISGVPFKHFVTRLPQNAQATEIQDIYDRPLRAMRAEQDLITDVRAYNFMFLDNWLAVIPQRRGRNGKVGVNSAGMLGVVWVASEEERAAWDELGPVDHLQYVGIPNIPTRS
ncbi:hypothetical protein S40293_01132 [Stachybotrys chartarum IBT 40293]|nr:hypothetical protein S40293_01132 [Stachybotrys chartarum IBT 40293]